MKCGQTFLYRVLKVFFTQHLLLLQRCWLKNTSQIQTFWHHFETPKLFRYLSAHQQLLKILMPRFAFYYCTLRPCAFLPVFLGCGTRRVVRCLPATHITQASEKQCAIIE